MGSTIILIIFMNTFSNFSDFCHMGGYAFYVWSAYGIAFGTLALILFLSQKQRQKTFKRLKERLILAHDTSTKKT